MDDIATALIEFDDFMKVDMRVGTVTQCEPIPKPRNPLIS